MDIQEQRRKFYMLYLNYCSIFYKLDFDEIRNIDKEKLCKDYICVIYTKDKEYYTIHNINDTLLIVMFFMFISQLDLSMLANLKLVFMVNKKGSVKLPF